jgi:HNH endonuclease
MGSVTRRTDLERLLDRTVLELHPELGSCWIWIGGTNSSGYGYLHSRDRIVGVHRLGYTLLAGPIPDGLEPHHLCHRRTCWNPAHLEPMTHYENLRRRTKPRQGSRPRVSTLIYTNETNCREGHQLAGDNLLVYALTGTRKCKACINERLRRVRERQKQYRNKYKKKS